MAFSTSNHMQNNFVNLPDEVLIDKILPRLPCEDLLARTCYVCKQWNQLMNDQMWQIVATCHFPTIKKDNQLTWKNKFKRKLSIGWNDSLEEAIKLYRARKAAKFFHTIILCGLKPPTADVCHFLMERQTEMAEALGILKEMQAVRLQTKEKTYAHLLSQCTKKKDTKGALAIINTMKDKDKDFTHLNKEEYEKLCNLCQTQEAQVESAKLASVISALFNPPIEHKNGSQALVAIGKLETVKRIYLRKMQIPSPAFHLQQDPFHVNLSRFVKYKNVKEVERMLLNRNQQNRLLGDSHSFECIINLLSENNNQQALQVFQEMLDEDIEPTKNILNDLFNLCYRIGDGLAALALLNTVELADMKKARSCKFIYETLMNLFLQRRDWQAMLAFIDKTERVAVKFHPEGLCLYLYPALICVSQKAIPEAFACLKRVDHLVTSFYSEYYDFLDAALKAEHAEMASFCLQKIRRLIPNQIDIPNDIIQRFNQLMARKNVPEGDENEHPCKRQKLEKS